MALDTGRVVDVVKQTDEAPHGGEGWVARETTMPQELGSLWAECGVTSEYGELKSVLMRTPGRRHTRHHTSVPQPPRIRLRSRSRR